MANNRVNAPVRPVTALAIFTNNGSVVYFLREVVMKAEFTAVFRKVPEGYIGLVEELPGANTQGATLEEARKNLAEAAELVLEANRELSQEDTRGQAVIREPLRLPAA